MAVEEWKPVVGYSGGYDVSSEGRVRNPAGHVMSPSRSESGHLRVNLWHGRGYITRHVHRLVLEAFVGQCPAGMEACHNNGIANDNRLINLRWDTLKSNHFDRVRHGRSNRGERCGRAVQTVAQVHRFVACLADGLTVKQAAARCGISSHSQAYRISTGYSWGHLWQQAPR
jgi:hypothetical protein